LQERNDNMDKGDDEYADKEEFALSNDN